jgi:hypothetical protein
METLEQDVEVLLARARLLIVDTAQYTQGTDRGTEV